MLPADAANARPGKIVKTLTSIIATISRLNSYYSQQLSAEFIGHFPISRTSLNH